MYAASGAGSAAGSANSKRFKLGANPLTRGGEDIDPSRRPSFENAVFGVLFTLSKENSEVRIVIRWVLLKILLDGWQIFTTVIQPAQGWNIDEDGMAWRIVSVLSFGWLADLGYGAYVALLYGMVALLAANIGLCVWVAWCFKEQKFPVVWPITVLRLFTSVFFQAFDVASLNLLQVGITCRLTGPEKPHLHLDLFPNHSCTQMPQLIHAMVSGISLLVFVALALLTNMAEVEVNPKSRRPMALGDSGPEVAAFAIKVLMTLTDVFFGWKKVSASIYLLLSMAMAWQYLRWNPSLVSWVNQLKAGVSASIVWCSIALMFLVFAPGVTAGHEEQFANWMTIALLAGLAPAMGVGALISWWLLRRTVNSATKAIGLATAKGVPLQDLVVDLWTNPRDVEIAARCARVWVDRNCLKKEAVAKAQLFIKAGLALFPGNAFVALVQANFMIDVLGVGQSGSRQVEAARKMSPGIMSRFMIFVRLQQAQQKAAGNTAGAAVGSNMDLLGFVEYQRKQRMVVRLHRDALTAMCSFWKALDSHTVSFTHLSKTLANIEVSVCRAQAAYRLVLETYGTNFRLVRLYGKFLETVKNDPWGALEYYTEADRLEQEKNDDGNGPLLPDGTPLSRMDDLSTAVVVITAGGEIQMANKQVHHLFGYKKGELDGKPITMLVAPQSGKRIIGALTRLVERSMEGLGQYQDDHDKDSSATAAVLGMHHERMAFPLRVSITKASGVGEDSTFIALLEPVHVSKDVSYFWVAPNGAITAVDPQFVANFGYLPHDVIGAHLGDFLVCDGDLAALRGNVASSSINASTIDHWEVSDGTAMEAAQPMGESVTMLHTIVGCTSAGNSAPCHVSHRYGSPLACAAAGRVLDLGDATLYEIKICRASLDQFLMLVTDKKGAVKFATPQLVSILCPRMGGTPAGQTADADAFKDRTDAGHKGAGHGLAILSGVAAAHGLIGGYNVKDFLPHPWKDTHIKLLKDSGGVHSTARNLWSCTRQAGKGPTMEMHDTHGQKLYMHVSVTSTELVGEHLHLTRMASSTVEAATNERRLRVDVSSEGIITAVSKDTPCQQLFGFEASQLIGRALWEVVDGVEQQLMQRPGSSLGRGAGAGQGNAAAFSVMLERTIRHPGRSWRVSVMPPAATFAGSAGSHNNAELAAAQRAAQVRAAVMQVHIPLVTSDDEDAELSTEGGDATLQAKGDVAVHVDLWPTHSVSGVLELNSLGRITSVLEEHARPAGLLFGVATKALLGQALTALVPLPSGRDEVGDLLLTGSRNKKSSMKQSVKDANVKVGPVHVLDALHSDGHPLKLSVQLVGKPGSAQPLTALLRLYVTPMVPGGEARSGDGPLVLPPPDAATTTPSIREMEDFVAQRSMNARSEKAVVLERSSTAKHTATFGGVSRMASPRARPTTPSTPVKSPAELMAAHGLGSGSHLGPQPPQLGGASKRVSLVGMAPDPPLGGASKRASLVGMAPEPPLPGVVMDGALPKAASRRDLGASKVAGALSGIKRKDSLLAGVEESDIEDSAGAKDDASSKDGSSSKGDASSKGSADPDDVKALNPKSMARVSEWVETKGEVYQNAKPTIDKPGDEGKSGDETGKSGDEGDDHDSTETDARSRTRSAAALGLSPGRMARPSGSERGAFTGMEGGALRGNAGGNGLSAMPPGLAPPTGSQAFPPGAGDFDDAGSNGGQSVMSGQSGASSGGEYKRGKRFRNLIKLMDSSEAEQVLRRFRRGALLAMAILAIAHTVCFALVVISIKGQQASMVQLITAGRSQRLVHEVLVSVRALDQILKGKAPANLYSTSDVDNFAKTILDDAAGVKDLNNYVVKANWGKPTVKDLYYFTGMPAWVAYNPTLGQDIYVNSTLWDLATKVYTTSKDIYQNYQNWTTAGINISSTDSGQFLLKTGPDLYNGYRNVLDALLYIAMDNTSRVNNLLLAFLVSEGCGVSVLAAALLAYLLRKLALQRYTLYGTFLAIPVGLTRALNAQLANTTLLEEEDEDEDEDDEGQGDDDRGGKTGGEGGGGDAGGGGGEGAKQRHRHATMDSPPPQPPQPPPPAGPAPGVRRSFHAMVMAAAAAAPPPGNPTKSAAASDAGGPTRPPQVAAVGRSMSQRGWRAAPQTWRGWLVYRLKALMPCLARRAHAVFPAPGEHGPHHRRTLRLDSNDTTRLLIPFVVWSCLVVTFYVVSVVELKQSAPLVAVSGVCTINTARTYRACFYAQELAAEEDPAQLEARRGAVTTIANELEDAFYTLQLGDEAWRSLGNDTEHFPLVTDGLSYETPNLQHLFYANTECLRKTVNLPCPGPDYRFYQVTHSGVDSIMQIYLGHLRGMAAEVIDVKPGLANDRLDFIYNVGTKDLTDANVEIRELHFQFIKDLYDGILLLHILLFVLLWAFLATYYYLLLRPLNARLAREKRHIAELMSQLPLELDVEKLVRAAIAGTAIPGATSSGHLTDPTAQAVPGAGDAQVVTDAAKAWKNVLRSTSHAIKDERERRSSILVTSNVIQ